MKLLPVIVVLALLQLALASCSSSGGGKEKSVKLWPAPGWETNEVHHAED